MTTWPFGDLKRGHYGAIYADPPWDWRSWRRSRGMTDAPVGSREVSLHYSVLDSADIGALPVHEISDENCVLFMWVTWPLLPQALGVIERWRFEYKTCAFSWMKADNRHADLFQAQLKADMTMGYWTRANSEVCLLATRGKPKRLHADVRQGIIEPRREHSRKPDCVYDRIERLVAGPYCELFARTKREGWDSWGNEVDKFKSIGSGLNIKSPRAAGSFIPPQSNSPITDGTP